MKATHLTISPFLAESNLYKSVYREARKVDQAFNALRNHTLTEGRQLSAREIDNIFRSVADGAAKGLNTADGSADPSSNRTFLGKGADAISGLKKKYDDLWKWLENTGPVQGFDTAFDSIQGDILNAMGGADSKTSEALQKYRAFAREHPVLQGFILAGVATIAAAATGLTGPVGLAAIGLGIRTINGLLKGDKFSQALRRGAEGAVIGYTVGQILQHLPGPAPAPAPTPTHPDWPLLDPAVPTQEFPINPDIVNPPVTPDVPVTPPDINPNLVDMIVRKDQVLSQIAKDTGHSVGELLQANPQISNPDALVPGSTLHIPLNGTSPDIYTGGVGTAADTAAKVAGGTYTDVPSALAIQRGAMGMRESKKPNPWIDRDATVRNWYLKESLSDRRGRSVMLTQKGIDKIFEQVTIRKYLLEAEGEEPAKKPGLLSRINSGLGAVGKSIGKAASKGWNAASNKISYDKLGMEWRKVDPNRVVKNPDDMIADSSAVELFLRNQGIEDSLIRSVFKSMGIPTDLIGSGGEEEAGAEQNAELFGRENGGKTQPAQAQAEPAAGGSGSFGSMVSQLQPPQASATGGATTTTATGTTHRASASNPNQAQAGGAGQAGGAAQGPQGASNPFAWDYKGATKAAGLPAQQAKPDYSKTMSGYGSQKMTMKMPAAQKPAATKEPAAEPATAESRRVYGGRYVRESLDERLLKEYKFFLDQR